MIRRIVNLPFRVLGKAARKFQDRQDAVMKATHGDGTSGDDFDSMENVPEFDTPAEFNTGSTSRAAAIVAEEVAGSAPVQLIDLRTPAAHAAQTLPGAMNLPLSTLGIRLAELPPANVRVVVFDDTGDTEAADAARFLRWRGFEDAWHMEGGLAAWLDAGHPSRHGNEVG
jgi:rhodanese-related sulfurtransferase